MQDSTRTALGPHKNLRLESPNSNSSDDDYDDETKDFQQQFYKDLRNTTKPELSTPGDPEEVLKSRTNLDECDLPTIDIDGLINRSFITNPNDDGEQQRAKIIDVKPTGETTADGKDAIVKFKCQHGDRMFEEVMSYNKMLEWCDRDLDKDDMYKLEGIVGHRKATLPPTNGEWEVLVQWASGAQSWNCLNLTYSDDPITVSLYAALSYLYLI